MKKKTEIPAISFAIGIIGFVLTVLYILLKYKS